MYTIKSLPEDFIVDEISDIPLRQDGEHGIYILKKRLCTTEKAVQLVAETLGIPRKWIGVAGNKDRVAITTQHISIWHEKRPSLSLRDISLELKGFSKKAIGLGDLLGNRFRIVVQTDQEPLHLTKIVNFFGPQRFSVNNAAIGKAIILKEFRKATDLMTAKGGEYELVCTSYLSKHPNDHVGALRLIPRNVLKLFVHAYQSKLWNELALIESKKKEPSSELPLIGFGTEETPFIKEIISREGITVRDFIIPSVPELSSDGGMRSLSVEVKELKIEKNEKGYVFSFVLPKGAYATEVIRQSFATDQEAL